MVIAVAIADELVECFGGVRRERLGFGSTYVALEGALEYELLSHIEFLFTIYSTKSRSGGWDGGVMGMVELQLACRQRDRKEVVVREVGVGKF